MALAGKHDHVAGAGRRQGQGDGRPPVGLDDDRLAAGRARRRDSGQDSSMIAAGSSDAGVVGGQHGQVGQPGRHLAHERTLGPVAVAPAAEAPRLAGYADRRPAMLPGRAGGTPPGRRGCGRSRPTPRTAGPDRPPRGGPGTDDRRREPSATTAAGHAELAGGGGRGQGVGDVERRPPDGATRGGPPTGNGPRPVPSRRSAASAREKLRVGQARSGQQPAAPGVVGVDHRHPGPLGREQARPWPRSSRPCRRGSRGGRG